MRFHVATELLRGDLGSIRSARVSNRVPGFKREFRIDHQGRRGVGHPDGAVGTRAVGQRLLESIGAHRQAIGDNRLHPRLAESAACLLIGEDRLQADDVLRQRLYVVLGGIDDGETLLQPLQVLVRRLGLFGDRRADALRHSVQALVDRLVQLGLPRAEHFGHRRHAPVHFRLDLQKLGHTGIRLGGAETRHLCLLSSHLPAAGDNDDQKQGQRGNCASSERQHGGACLRQGEEKRLRAGVHAGNNSKLNRDI